VAALVQLHDQSQSMTALPPQAGASSQATDSFVHARLHRLGAQQRQLDRFATFHAHAVMRTQDDPALLVQAQSALVLRESALLPGLIGVFAGEDLAVTFRCPYPGVQMSHHLHSEFHARYHVPTAVRLNSTHTLVGDPCALACHINGSRSRSPPLTAAGESGQENSGPQTAEANVKLMLDQHSQAGSVTLLVQPLRPLCSGEELLLEYGNHFWRHAQRVGEYCQICFRRDASVLNKMFLCDHAVTGGGPSSCRVGQHADCFDSATALPARSQSWYCFDHLRSAPHS
jgi:hypothetical protein